MTPHPPPPRRPRGTVNTPPPQARLTEYWVIVVSCFNQGSKNSLAGQIQAMWLFPWQLQCFFKLGNFALKCRVLSFLAPLGPHSPLAPCAGHDPYTCLQARCTSSAHPPIPTHPNPTAGLSASQLQSHFLTCPALQTTFVCPGWYARENFSSWV